MQESLATDPSTRRVLDPVRDDMHSGPVLSVADLSVWFGSRQILDRVSLSLSPGQRLGLVGESGSGKSLTALSIMRLLPESRVTGSVKLGSTELLSLSRKKMERIRGGRVAMIYQDPMSSLNPVHSIGRQLTESLLLHTELSRRGARDRATDLLAEVGIADPVRRLDSFPHEFSGGQRQRIMIAIALCGSPEVLIADEPTTALDVTTQARILDLLDDIISQHGMAVLLITHDLGVAAGFCDDINVMHNGRVVEAASAEELHHNPQHAYTRSLFNNVVDMTTDVSRPIPIASMADSGEPTTPATAIPRLPTARTSTTQTGPLVSAQALVKRFRQGHEDLVAVNDVSLSIMRGETLGVVGESGSGKTTTSRCVLGLTAVDSGTVTFDGHELGGQSRSAMRDLRRRMQIVFQDPFAALNRRQTARELVCAPLAAHHIGRRAERLQRAEAMLARVGLGPQYYERLPRELSGGQCQRVAIARALVLEPEFVVLDEAVSALDASIRAQVLNLLRELQEEMGLTYLFVSHDLSVVRYMSSRIMVMRSGRVVESGTREELFAHPTEDYTKSLLAAVPMTDPLVEKARRKARRRTSGSDHDQDAAGTR